MIGASLSALNAQIKLMAGDREDRRAASLLAQAEAFADGALAALIELADSGYGAEAESLAESLIAHLRAI